MSVNDRSLTDKYRPIFVEDLIGQEAVASQISGMLKSGKIPGTFLISGPTGNGKTTTARILARYINCEKPKPVIDRAIGDPCGSCRSCLAIGTINHLAVHEIDAAENRGIDDVRRWIELSHMMPQTPYRSRIFIIDEAHGLTSQALTSFLKTLEEPSKWSTFILCTNEPQKLPATIVGRCTRLELQQVSTENCTEMLEKVVTKEGVDVPGDLLQKIAQSSKGHCRNALKALESVIAMTLSGGEINLDSLPEAVFGINVEKDVKLYLFAVYQKRYTSSLLQIKNTQNAKSFIETCIRFHIQTINYTCSSHLRDPYFVDYYELLDAQEQIKTKASVKTLPSNVVYQGVILDPVTLGKVLDVFYNSYKEASQFIFQDPSVILTAMTMRAIREFN